jgi:hypothetical protein
VRGPGCNPFAIVCTRLQHPLAFSFAENLRKNKIRGYVENRGLRGDLPGGALLRLYRTEKIISGVCSPSQEIFISFLMRSMPLRYCTSCNTLQCALRFCLTDLVKIESLLPRATDLSVPDC